MIRLVLSIYRFMSRHLTLGIAMFMAVTISLAWAVTNLRVDENITDFLPDRDGGKLEMEIYGEASGADRVYAVFHSPRGDADALVEAVDEFVRQVEMQDSDRYVRDITSVIDDETVEMINEAIYASMPVLLTDADYERIDSLLAEPEYARLHLAELKAMLQLPASGIVASTVANDPLGLYAPVTSRLTGSPATAEYLAWDGHLLSADSLRAFAVIESSFPSAESASNALLVEMLGNAWKATGARDDITVTFTGSPVIAVENASRIRHDSTISILVAVLAIVALLAYVFRDAVNILLIFVSVAWGWFMALGCIAIIEDNVSIIVIGIASVLVGIAVNYPLHLIDTLSRVKDRSEALKEVVGPLVIGNITTVGAFACLIPLESPALHDLGLFASLMLVGTILFVLVMLPPLVRYRPDLPEPGGIIRLLSSISPHGRRWILPALVVVTVVMAWYAGRTSFDADLRNINYLSPEQRELYDMMGKTFDNRDNDITYVVATGTSQEATYRLNERVALKLDSLEAAGLIRRRDRAEDFAISDSLIWQRQVRWHQFLARADSIVAALHDAAEATGFSRNAFDPFVKNLDDYINHDGGGLWLLTHTMASDKIIGLPSRGMTAVVSRIEPSDGVTIDDISDLLGPGVMVFDVESMNGSLVNALAADFNYIGLVCGLIVFLFLWLSMRSVAMAGITFLPMAIGWVWILGVMGMLDMQFNIVNIILATFIFGQGDDYTIFVVEGLIYEQKYGRRVVARYKSGIIVSALLMFAGIGVLAFASHPAMRSLGQVTVVGMVIVVLMAYVVPPLAFKFMMQKKKIRL